MGNSAAGLLGSAPIVTGTGILAGSILGANTHTLLTAETPAHTHTLSVTSGAGGSHTHSFSATTSSDGSHIHSGTTGVENSSITHTVAPGTPSTQNGGFTGPGGNGWGGTVGTATTSGVLANHTHNFNTDAGGTHNHTVSGTTGAEASHTHSVSGTTSSIGSGTAHNNLSRAAPVTWFIKL
jgi:hypothetical protein